MLRRRVPAAASVCALLFASALLAASNPKPVPIVSRATRTGVSAPASSLHPVLRTVTGKEPPKEEREVENDEIKRVLGPLGYGDRPDAAISGPVAPNMPGPSLTFEGLSADDLASVFGFRVEPPDTVADVGPNHVVLMVNSLSASTTRRECRRRRSRRSRICSPRSAASAARWAPGTTAIPSFSTIPSRTAG